MAKKAKEQKLPKQSRTPQITEENRYAVFGMLFVFLVLVFFASSYKVTGDDDFFWHLATGRYIVENKTVPDKDVFGFVTQGVEWIAFEWGWDVLSYGLYNVGGYNLILIFRSLVFCLIFYIYFLLLKKFKLTSFVSILVLFTLLVSIMDRLSPRPHILTYLFFTLLLYIFLSFKYIDRDTYFKKLYFLPLIFLLWSNIHMGVLAGGLLLFIFVISETMIFYKPNLFSSPEIKPLTSTQLKTLFIISAICALMLLVNPHGLQTYIYAYSHTKMKMLKTVNEWQSPFASKLDFGFIITLYKVFLFSGLIVLAYAYKKKDLTFALVFIGFALYSVRAIRFTVDYEIIMAFFISVSINYFILRLFKKNFTVMNALRGNFLVVAIAVFIIYVITQIPSNNIYATLKYYRVFGWGINDEFIPVQLFDFMKQNNISGTPYNHFGTGGYLVWNFPEQRNFIDSRNLNDEIFNEYNSIMVMKPGFEKILDERGINYVVYLDPDLIRRPNDLKRLVTNYFSRNSNWKLVFWDDKSMLFIKNIPKFSGVIEKYEYKVIHPYTALFHKQEFDSNVKANPDRANDELIRKAQTDANGYLFRGMNEMAVKLLQGL
ncbi:MAG: hypothetical protein L0Y79_05115 [Chlorobi bacterium]|nr:hypothetical protein [Chlorobiota bacterium]MCI0715577.1 hypothetical protein [Chlorobiota bacterium]